MRIWIRDLFGLDLGSGMKKFRPGIRHKHPGSATLQKRTNHLIFVYQKLLVWDSVLVDFVSSFTALMPKPDSQA
jgi:hypothetical protein